MSFFQDSFFFVIVVMLYSHAVLFTVNVFVLANTAWNCPYSEFFCSVFTHIYAAYQDLVFRFPYLVRMRENTDQKNSEYKHVLRSILYFDAFLLFPLKNIENKKELEW